MVCRLKNVSTRPVIEGMSVENSTTLADFTQCFVKRLVLRYHHQLLESHGVPPHPRRVNGYAVLRFAPALRVTPLARCGTEALKGLCALFGPR